MDISFLTPSTAEFVTSYLKDTKLEDHEAWIRFWNKDSVQIDGDMTLEELKELVALMEFIK